MKITRGNAWVISVFVETVKLFLAVRRAAQKE